MSETTVETQLPDISFVYVYKQIDEAGEAHKSMMVDSLKITYPNYPVYMAELTCEKNHMMIYRSIAEAHARKTIRGPLVFLDTDIIAMRPAPFVELLKETWDVALVNGAENPYLIMPFCGGFKIVRDNQAGQDFMDMARNAATRVPEGMITDGWWVDQLAIFYAAEHTPGLNVGVLPRKMYNFVPEKAQSTMAYFVHLKGPRKHLMRQYYNGVRKTDHTGF